MSEFFAMGGYAGFVWPAYAITAAVLGGMCVRVVWSLRRTRREVAALDAAQKRKRP